MNITILPHALLKKWNETNEGWTKEWNEGANGYLQVDECMNEWVKVERNE